MALGILAWFYGYYDRKSNDNRLSLSLIAEMEEADVNELLVGYRRIQLRTVWDEPDFINSNEDVWEINEQTFQSMAVQILTGDAAMVIIVVYFQRKGY